jgi:hypothetical protein
MIFWVGIRITILLNRLSLSPPQPKVCLAVFGDFYWKKPLPDGRGSVNRAHSSPKKTGSLPAAKIGRRTSKRRYGTT